MIARSLPFPVLVPPPVEGGLGAVRVELRGERAGERTTVVYGALDRPAIASGAVAAVAAIELLGGRMPAGVAGLAASGRHLPMLVELARRGVRAAAFEGGNALSAQDRALRKVLKFRPNRPMIPTQSEISRSRGPMTDPRSPGGNIFREIAQVRRARVPMPVWPMFGQEEISVMGEQKNTKNSSMRTEPVAVPATPLTPAEITALIEEHLPLVNHVVFQVAVHFPRHVDRDELARAGALGLVEAAKRYDEARGVPFNRFAAQRIRGAIIDGVRAADWAPRSVRALARRLDQVEQTLANQLGRVPSLGETAAALDISREELDRLRDRLFRSVVLAFDSLVGDTDDEELTLVDVLTDSSSVEPCEELESRELHAYLRDAVALLPERHRMVVVGYFIEEKTSQDLARFLGVTESRVSQMRTEALAMLRQGIEAQYVGEDASRGAPGPGGPPSGPVRRGDLLGIRLGRPHLGVDRSRGTCSARAGPVGRGLTPRRRGAAAGDCARLILMSRAGAPR